MLAHRIETAACHLGDKLTSLDIKSVGISEYNQRFLSTKIFQLKGSLQTFAYLLWLSFRDSLTPVDNAVFVDYGGGSGVMSFLAKEMGVKTVIYNDIYDVSCVDVRRLSNQLELPLDHVVCGDIDDLVQYCRVNSLSVDALASYDVIEHIYDIEYHVKRLSALSSSSFVVVHASGANTHNPLYVRRTMRRHREAEHDTRQKTRGWKERDTVRAYLEVRRDIIAAYAPELSLVQLENLARLTRGLRKDDIEKRVDEYQHRGTVDYVPDHPTNTCDPYTGNWCEHLMDIGWLERVFRGEGFSVDILSGCWTFSPGALPKNIIKFCLNGVIRMAGRRALCVAPYFVVYARHSEG